MWPWAWRRPFCIFWGCVLTGPLDGGRRARVRGGGLGPGQHPEAGNAGKRIACGQLAPRPPARGHGRGSSRCIRVSCDGTTGHSRLSGSPTEARQDHPGDAAERPTRGPRSAGGSPGHCPPRGARPPPLLQAGGLCRPHGQPQGRGWGTPRPRGRLCLCGHSTALTPHLPRPPGGAHGGHAASPGIPGLGPRRPHGTCSGVLWGPSRPNRGAPANQLEEHGALRDESCFQGGRGA